MKGLRNFLLPLLLGLALVFAGCASPPDAEKAAAKTAMDGAESAGAGKYATAEFDAAKKMWDATEAQMTNKKYDEAKKGYVNAKTAFEKATAAAVAGRKAATDEATAALTALDESWKSLEATAKDLEKKMKDKKEAWEVDVKVFTDGMKIAKDSLATDPTGAKNKAADLKTIIDKWDATFKEIAAAPVAPAAKKGKKK